MHRKGFSRRTESASAFLHKGALHSFIPACDLHSLSSCHSGRGPSEPAKKTPPLLPAVCRHSEVLTADAPRPVVTDLLFISHRPQHSVERLPLAGGGREARAGVPCCCNYITTSLAVPRPLTQLFLENINFNVSSERM